MPLKPHVPLKPTSPPRAALCAAQMAQPLEAPRAASQRRPADLIPGKAAEKGTRKTKRLIWERPIKGSGKDTESGRPAAVQPLWAEQQQRVCNSLP